MDGRKFAAIQAWPVLQSTPEVRRFVGGANYYRRFLTGFRPSQHPLRRYAVRGRGVGGGVAEQASFQALQALLSTAPVLRPFDPAVRPVLWCDASIEAVAHVLTQPDAEGRHHPVAFESRRLSAAERLKPPHELELLSVRHGLATLRHYLLGSNAPRRTPDCRSDFTLSSEQPVGLVRVAVCFRRSDFVGPGSGAGAA